MERISGCAESRFHGNSAAHAFLACFAGAFGKIIQSCRQLPFCPLRFKSRPACAHLTRSPSLTDESEARYTLINKHGEPSEPATLARLRSFVRTKTLRPSTPVLIGGNPAKQRAWGIPEIRELFAEARCLRLVTKIYRHVKSGRLRAAARATKHLERSSAKIQGDPLAEDAKSFQKAIEDITSEGSLSRAITWLVTGVACIGIAILFVSSVARTAADLSAKLLAHVETAKTTDEQKAYLAELDAAVFLFNHSPHIRLARALHVGPDEERIAEIQKLSMEVGKAVHEAAWQGPLVRKALETSDNLILDHHYREAIRTAETKISRVGMLGADALIAEVRKKVGMRIERYFAGEKEKIRTLLAAQDFESARKTLQEVIERIPEGFLQDQLEALIDELPRLQKVRALLTQARKAAALGRLSECEATLKKIEDKIARDPNLENVQKRLEEIRQLARQRAVMNAQKAIEHQIRPLIIEHKFSKALGILEAEGKRLDVILPYVRMRSAEIWKTARTEVDGLEKTVSEFVAARDFVRGRKQLVRYGKTRLDNLDARLALIDKGIVLKAREYVAGTRAEAEKLILAGERKKGEHLIYAIKRDRLVKEVVSELKTARQLILKLSRGSSEINTARNYMEAGAYKGALEHLQKALDLLPESHELARKARRMRDEIKKNQGG